MATATRTTDGRATIAWMMDNRGTACPAAGSSSGRPMWGAESEKYSNIFLFIWLIVKIPFSPLYLFA